MLAVENVVCPGAEASLNGCITAGIFAHRQKPSPVGHSPKKVALAKETAGQEVIRELDNWITKLGGLVMLRGPPAQEEYERQGQQRRITTIEERDLISMETHSETLNLEVDLGRLKQETNVFGMS